MIAKLTFDALSDVGINQDGGMSKVYVEATDVTCTISNNGIEDTQNSPSCTLTATWATDCQDH